MTVAPSISFRAYHPRHANAVRKLHQAAWSHLARERHTPEQMAAHEVLIQAPEYAAAMADNNLILAWREERLLGTAGWCPVEDEPDTARIRKVFVDPETAGTGLGRRLVLRIEEDNRRRGIRRFTVRSNANAEGFYAALGYRPLSRGVMAAPGADLPVVFMEKSA